MAEYFESGSEKPIEFEFRAWADQLHSEFSDLHQEQQGEEDIYFQRFEVYVPTATGPSPSKPVKTGSAPADADAAMDSLVPSKILINVRPARGKQKYRDQAD